MKTEIKQTREYVLRNALNTALFSAHLNGKDNPEQSYFEWEKNNDAVTGLIGLIREILDVPILDGSEVGE